MLLIDLADINQAHNVTISVTAPAEPPAAAYGPPVADKLQQLYSLFRDPEIQMVMSDEKRAANMEVLSQFFATATATNTTAVLSPPSTPRGRCNSVEACVPASPCSAGYFSESDSAFSSPPHPGVQQDNPLNILDAVMNQSPEAVLLDDEQYDLDDLMAVINDNPETKKISQPQLPVSQQSFSTQAVQNEEELEKQLAVDQANLQAIYANNLGVNPQYVSQEMYNAGLVSQESDQASPTITLDDIDEILSQASSPGYVNENEWTPTTSAQKSSRGRKRKLDADPDFATTKEEAKRLKNAVAAQRYREKLKSDAKGVELQLREVQAEHNRLATRFNDKLTERNFMLKLVFEAHLNNLNGLGARKFPEWVRTWYEAEQAKNQ